MPAVPGSDCSRRCRLTPTFSSPSWWNSTNQLPGFPQQLVGGEGSWWIIITGNKYFDLRVTKYRSDYRDLFTSGGAVPIFTTTPLENTSGTWSNEFPESTRLTGWLFSPRTFQEVSLISDGLKSPDPHYQSDCCCCCCCYRPTAATANHVTHISPRCSYPEWWGSLTVLTAAATLHGSWCFSATCGLLIVIDDVRLMSCALKNCLVCLTVRRKGACEHCRQWESSPTSSDGPTSWRIRSCSPAHLCPLWHLSICFYSWHLFWRVSVFFVTLWKTNWNLNWTLSESRFEEF